METIPQFCLRWNNYQSTLHHIFHKLWSSGTFVDVSLVVEGRKIECHKIILSACSTYFEKLLSEHSAHPHPLILLHDIPYSAVEALVVFMYKGEINVSHDQLTALLKAADTLKIKGLADSAAISDFTKYRLMSSDFTKALSAPYTFPLTNTPTTSPFIPSPNVSSGARWIPGSGARQPKNMGLLQVPASPHQSVSNKRPEPPTVSLSNPLKKRPRPDDSNGLPLSPPTSLEEPQVQEQAKPPQPETHSDELHEIKVEPEDETDTELQIDESAGQSTEESTESDGISNRNTPVLEFDPQELRERHETAQSLAAMATQGAINFSSTPSPVVSTQPLQINQNLFVPKTKKIKEEKPHTGGSKSTERSYTFQDLEEGIEAVLMGHLTPAKAIAKYKVPRRTFFRRLSAVRKSRGIPSSKENNASSDHFLNSRPSPIPTSQPSQGKNSHVPLIIPGIVSNESFLQNICNVPKDDSEDLKREKKSSQGLNLSTGNVFSLLNVANVNYDYYMKYLKQQTQPKDSPNVTEVKKDQTVVDGNSNLASEVSGQALGLVSQNGS